MAKKQTKKPAKKRAKKAPKLETREFPNLLKRSIQQLQGDFQRNLGILLQEAIADMGLEGNWQVDLKNARFIRSPEAN